MEEMREEITNPDHVEDALKVMKEVRINLRHWIKMMFALSQLHHSIVTYTVPPFWPQVPLPVRNHLIKVLCRAPNRLMT